MLAASLATLGTVTGLESLELLRVAEGPRRAAMTQRAAPGTRNFLQPRLAPLDWENTLDSGTVDFQQDEILTDPLITNSTKSQRIVVVYLVAR